MVLSDLSIGIGIHFCRGKPPTGGNLSRTEAGKITGKESLCEHKGSILMSGEGYWLLGTF